MKTTKKQEAEFTKVFTRYLDAFAPASNRNEYLLETKAGPLSVVVYDYWLACRFLEVTRACQHFGVRVGSEYGHTRFNGHSGKWNFHFSAECTPQRCLDAFSEKLSQLLP